MTGFPSSLRSVFGGRTGTAVPVPQHAPHAPRTWPLFKLVTPTRVERPGPELAKMVECEIIPRLMLAHKPAVAESPVGPIVDRRIPLGAETTEKFARMVLARSPDALTDFVGTLLRGGVSPDAVYADLLAPTARLLGDLWDQDRVSYTEATIGLGRLQQLIRDLDWTTPYNGEGDVQAHSALFAPRPGEQQTFGFYMIEELVRWSGWRTWIETATTDTQLAAVARCQWFDILCLSVTRETHIEEVARTIEAVRRMSKNPDLFVLVSGRPFVDRPGLVAIVGADGVASTAGETQQKMDRAVARVATA